LSETEEEVATRGRCAAVETESELVEIGIEMLVYNRALVAAKQLPFQQ